MYECKILKCVSWHIFIYSLVHDKNIKIFTYFSHSIHLDELIIQYDTDLKIKCIMLMINIQISFIFSLFL